MINIISMGSPTYPLEISGCVLWLKADAIIGLNDGDAITTWYDQSGEGHNAGMSTADYKPSYQTNEVNGKPVVRFDGANDGLLTSGLPTFTDATIFVVIKHTVIGEWDTIFCSSDGGFSLYFDSASKYNYWNDPEEFASSIATTTGAYGIWRFTINQAASAMHLNGSSVASGDLGSHTFSDLYIGNDNTWACALSCDIAEIITYNKALSTPYANSVEDYLGTKYGVKVIV